MSDVQVPPPRLGDPSPPPSDLDAAYSRVAVAYRLARRAVFDLHPHGLDDGSELTDAQRVVLRHLADAEAGLDEQRHLEWERSGVAGHPVA